MLLALIKWLFPFFFSFLITSVRKNILNLQILFRVYLLKNFYFSGILIEFEIN